MAVEPSPLGRIFVPDQLPPGKALFYTTADFHGRLDPEIADEIRGLIAQRFGIDPSLATCNQVHGTAVQRVKSDAEWRECKSCDALWTSERGVALGIKVADCLPVTISGDGVIANVHSGWRGAAAGITAAAVDAVPLERSKALAWLGPSIRVCCFEVGEEVARLFPGEFVDRTRAKPHVDIPAFTIALLRERGLAAERIFDSGLCTRCEGSMFHSFRREGKGGGRNLAIVAQ